MRYERKYRLEHMEFARIRQILHAHPMSFRTHHPDRYVNNIYLDTPLLEFYKDNLIGVGERLKYRVRWYGRPFENCDSPQLEAKIKHTDLGEKEIIPLESFSLNQAIHPATFYTDVLRPSRPEAPFEGTKLTHQEAFQRIFAENHLQPTLFNSYLRSYLISYDGHFRLTIDREMQAASALSGLKPPFRWFEDPAVVIEIKYEQEMHKDWDRVAQSLPFRLSKNSKYAIGMELAGIQ